MNAAPRSCPYCGAPLAPQMRACPSCGRAVAAQAAPAATAAPKKRVWLIAALVAVAGVFVCVCIAGVGLLAYNFLAPSQPQIFSSRNFPALQTAEPAAVQVVTVEVVPLTATPQPEQITAPEATPVPPTEAPQPASDSGQPAGGSGSTAVDYNGLHFTYDPRLFTQASPATVPASAADAAPWEVAPEHIQVSFGGYPLQGTFHEPQIIVYPIDAYVKLNPDVQRVADKLQTQLKEQGSVSSLDLLPFLPTWNAAQILHTQIKYLGSNGMRYLTMYAQSTMPVSNHDLFYTYQGLAGNGKYYVVAILPVSHPSLPATGDISQADFESFAKNYEKYLKDIVSKLDAEPPASFTPNLELLDQMVESITVTK